MPFKSNTALPSAVQTALPAGAQSIWRNAFNSADSSGASEESAFRQAWGAVKNAGFRKQPNGKWKKVEKHFDFDVEIEKFDDEQRVVYGWANVVVDDDGASLVDRQGHMISVDELERAQHLYMMDARGSTDMHDGDNVAIPVCSIVTTPEIKKALGIESERVGWFIGLKVQKDEQWALVKNGKRPMFSIGGRGILEEIAQ